MPDKFLMLLLLSLCLVTPYACMCCQGMLVTMHSTPPGAGLMAKGALSWPAAVLYAGDISQLP